MIKSIKKTLNKFGVSLVMASFVAASMMVTSIAEAANVAVHKSAGCMCCDGWSEHLRTKGHAVNVIVDEDLFGYKETLGVPGGLWACHTAMVEGYIIEGHVPAEEIERLLVERPDALGLAVAGMPVGSPGMESGNRVQPYNVYLFRADGTAEIYASYN
jgi:hypothetical protein